jgi:hypothetical protein
LEPNGCDAVGWRQERTDTVSLSLGIFTRQAGGHRVTCFVATGTDPFGIDAIEPRLDRGQLRPGDLPPGQLEEDAVLFVNMTIISIKLFQQLFKEIQSSPSGPRLISEFIDGTHGGPPLKIQVYWRWIGGCPRPGPAPQQPPPPGQTAGDQGLSAPDQLRWWKIMRHFRSFDWPPKKRNHRAGGTIVS